MCSVVYEPCALKEDSCYKSALHVLTFTYLTSKLNDYILMELHTSQLFLVVQVLCLNTS